jgi:ketosteroid isomerase-like protein
MFERLQRGDVEAIASFFSNDADVFSIAAGRTVRGRDEVASTLARLFENDRRVEASTFHYEGDGKGRVAVSGRLRVHNERGLVDIPAVWVYDIVNGEIVRARGYASAAEAEGAFRTRGDRGSRSPRAARATGN